MRRENVRTRYNLCTFLSRFRVLKVVHLTANVYSLSVRAPETVKSFTFRKYQQTRNGNIQYMDEVALAHSKIA